MNSRLIFGVHQVLCDELDWETVPQCVRPLIEAFVLRYGNELQYRYQRGIVTALIELNPPGTTLTIALTVSRAASAIGKYAMDEPVFARIRQVLGTDLVPGLISALAPFKTATPASNIASCYEEDTGPLGKHQKFSVRGWADEVQITLSLERHT